MILTDEGDVYGVGANDDGQLGQATTIGSFSSFQKLPISGVKHLACGFYHSILLLEDGTVKSVGINSSGQLLNGNTTTQRSLVSARIEGVSETWDTPLKERKNYSLVKQENFYKKYLVEVKRVMVKDESYTEGFLYRSPLNKQAKSLTLQ